MFIWVGYIFRKLKKFFFNSLLIKVGGQKYTKIILTQKVEGKNL